PLCRSFSRDRNASLLTIVLLFILNEIPCVMHLCSPSFYSSSRTNSPWVIYLWSPSLYSSSRTSYPPRHVSCSLSFCSSSRTSYPLGHVSCSLSFCSSSRTNSPLRRDKGRCGEDVGALCLSSSC